MDIKVNVKEETPITLSIKEEANARSKIDNAFYTGESAYEIAVDNGFVGTEEEWLATLKGKDGKDYVITEDDYDAIAEIIEPKVKPFWGGISGNVGDQSDLKDELDKKLDTVSTVSNLEIDDLFK